MAKRVKLPPEEYKKLKLLVLKRDKWKCRCCGNRNSLHVHHIRYRSSGGDDSSANLITLCNKHHDDIHNHKLWIVQAGSYVIDANNEVTFEK